MGDAFRWTHAASVSAAVSNLCKRVCVWTIFGLFWTVLTAGVSLDNLVFLRHLFLLLDAFSFFFFKTPRIRVLPHLFLHLSVRPFHTHTSSALVISDYWSV